MSRDWDEECSVLLKQVESLDKMEKELLVHCINGFKPLKSVLTKQINVLEGIKNPLKDYEPYGSRVQTLETFKYTYLRLGSIITSLEFLRKDFNLYVTRLMLPFIISSKDSNKTEYSEKFKEFKEDLADVANKLNELNTLVKETMLKDANSKNKDAMRLIYYEIEGVICELHWFREEMLR